MNLNDPITVLKGVGAARAQSLLALGIVTVSDLLRHLPRGYEDRTKFFTLAQAEGDQAVCIRAVMGTKVSTARIRQGLSISKCRIFDDSSTADVVFFNRTYLENQLILGEEYIFYGKVNHFGKRLQLDNPQFEKIGKDQITGRILPIYPLTAKITRNYLLGLVAQILKAIPSIYDPIPQDILTEHQLSSLDFALRNIHFPTSHQGMKQATNRLSFDQLVTYSTALFQMKHFVKSKSAPRLKPVAVEEFLNLLPFTLTCAQRRAIDDIFGDMTTDQAMNRLVQGDVGSGKTVVAAAAVFLAAKNQMQSAVMAPTEILATQHYNTLSPMMARLGIRCALLQSSTPKSEKQRIYSGTADGSIDLLIGTHALLQDSVVFRTPALFVIDEQHRFGVGQRAKLSQKGEGCHTLVMSATPIPRTLNLIIYGELDVSVIDELPPNRQVIETYAVNTGYDKRLYAFIDKQIQENGQVYIVCPLALENEESDLASAQEYEKNLRTNIFPDYKTAMLHGKLKSPEKARIMGEFMANEIEILVSTTVIEVGVDVPNATLIVVRNAERFGLSQLHQLRGRVGRGSRQSYCILVSDSTNEDTQHRLKVMTKTANGFEVAQEDLLLRGPGDFFGQAQHGLPCYGAIVNQADMETVAKAQHTAQQVVDTDPTLSQPHNKWILDSVTSLRQKMGETGLN